MSMTRYTTVVSQMRVRHLALGQRRFDQTPAPGTPVMYVKYAVIFFSAGTVYSCKCSRALRAAPAWHCSPVSADNRVYLLVNVGLLLYNTLCDLGAAWVTNAHFCDGLYIWRRIWFCGKLIYSKFLFEVLDAGHQSYNLSFFSAFSFSTPATLASSYSYVGFPCAIPSIKNSTAQYCPYA